MESNKPVKEAPTPKFSREALNNIWYKLADGEYYLENVFEVEKVGSFITKSGYLYKVTGWEHNVNPAALTTELVKKYDPVEVEKIVNDKIAVLAMKVVPIG